MSQFRFNQVFFAMVALALLGALVIPPSVTDRAKGKEELLLWPIVRPVRAIAGMFQSKYGDRPLPPGERGQRSDSELAAENALLRQQVVFLNGQLDGLKLVEEERRRLGPLLDSFAPVTVIGGDASPDRESLGLAPASAADMSPGTPVLCAEGVVGKVIDGRRVRLISDKGFTITGQFGRWENGRWRVLETPEASVRGAGGGAMRVENLTVAQAGGVQAGDWVVINDPDWDILVGGPSRKKLLQGRQLGQVEHVRPIPAKPLFAEITIRPRTDLRKLGEVLVLKR